MEKIKRSKPLGKKTGPKPTFTRQDVISAAWKCGIADFTLGQVARELGVSTPAIYRLFESREEVLNAAIEESVKMMSLDTEGMGWKEILLGWANKIWECCEKYPGISVLISTNPASFRYIKIIFLGLLKDLEKQGFTRGQAMFALDFIGDNVIATHVGMEALAGRSPFKCMDNKNAPDKVKAEMTKQFQELGVKSFQMNGRGFLDTKLDFIIRGLETDRPSV
ncbi:TetR/AcrR family transcriptional regulator [Actinomycetaceae bacterium TAE3-ERU4]|nr:TetR/AcrR family transcriptional regulator [Actinomycetaceae bacterium TAE3-ERU4]